MKILINTPDLKIIGGVASHYAGLKLFWNEDVKYNVVGKRRCLKGSGIYCLPWDIVKFIFKLSVFHPDVVMVNPSLGTTAMMRDSIFINIANALNYKVAVFIHGFNWDYANKVDKKKLVNILNKASLIFVLGNIFKKELISWGIKTSIVLTTTKVDDNLLRDFTPDVRSSKVGNILYLARVEKAKGVYETIEVFNLLKKRYPDLTLTIVGDGTELSFVREYITYSHIPDVTITGGLSGETLIRAFKNADIYILMSYSEGMPTSVLEAMAFGLPVFTRNLGGLPDFFENGKMGFITDSLSPKDFAEAIEPYIEDANLTRRVSLYNYRYANEHFMASAVCRRIEKELINII